MGKDRSSKGVQQTRMDQYTAQNAGGSLQKDSSGPTEKGAEPTGAQILAAFEASGQAVQTVIAAMAVNVNLLRADLRVVAERSVATEQQRQVDNSDASEFNFLVVRDRIEDLGGQLDNYFRRDFRQRLYREEDHSGVC
ncbi:hypothetical protein NDU88_002329 [Pleurodeles waltl]|uniref:Uncharacterized protein n=1 Tax=Pleurodeles waltl TaxID=8319 RepID=A0AAV7TKX8_PLEWA|nr:hypothetical protein NDU88_002329 [Pleurodeles waltl]